MSRYHRDNPDAPISHDWFAGHYAGGQFFQLPSNAKADPMPTRKPDPTNRSRVQAAINELQIVDRALAGEFSVEHLIVAEPWNDRFDCLKWAVESHATVKEMIIWHRAQNGLDLFTEDEPVPAIAHPICQCGRPCYLTSKGVVEKQCLQCMPF